MQMEKSVSYKYRVCFVSEKAALFHGWYQLAQPYTALLRGHASGQIAEVRGIVEYADGQVDMVKPTQIRFADKTSKEYCLLEREELERKRK